MPLRVLPAVSRLFLARYPPTRGSRRKADTRYKLKCRSTVDLLRRARSGACCAGAHAACGRPMRRRACGASQLRLGIRGSSSDRLLRDKLCASRRTAARRARTRRVAGRAALAQLAQNGGRTHMTATPSVKNGLSTLTDREMNGICLPVHRDTVPRHIVIAT